MAVLKNRAKMSTSTTGTGTITLGSAESGYQTFADAGVANADVVRYVIEDTGGAFEIGTGTYTATGTTLSRTVSESSNSDAAINLSGSATVFIGATAEDIPALYAENYDGTSTLPSATGTNAISLAPLSTSTGINSVSIGSSADATGNQAFSFGVNSAASGLRGISFGSGSFTNNQDAVAIGPSAMAQSVGGLALGHDATVITGAQAVAIGDSYASGADSFAAAIGNNTSTYGATGANSVAIGAGLARATTSRAMAFGNNARAEGADSVAIGRSTDATASASFGFGYAVLASHANSVVLGTSASSSAINQITLGSSSDSVRISSAFTLPTAAGSANQVLTTAGDGTTSWAAAGGGGGASEYTIDNKTAAYTVVSGDLGKILNYTSGTVDVTLTALSSLTTGFYVSIWNSGTGVISIKPNSVDGIGVSAGNDYDSSDPLKLEMGTGVTLVNSGTYWQIYSEKAYDYYHHSVTLGANAKASNNYAMALGNRSSASSVGAIAIGTGQGHATTASSSHAVAIGLSTASGANSTALGTSYASGSHSFAAAIANNTSSYGATGSNSVAIGHQAKSTGLGSVAIGYGNPLAQGNVSFATQRGQATGGGSIAMGHFNTYGFPTASGLSAIVIGDGNTGSATRSVVLGNDSTSSHTDAIVIGGGASSSAADQITLGHTDQTVRISSSYTLPTSDGSANQVLTTDGSGAVTFADAGGGGGDPDLYRDNASSATTPVASGTNAVSIGSNSTATGTASVAIGQGDGDATGDYAFAVAGQATNTSAISIGTSSAANGFKSVSLGADSRASGTRGVAIGANAQAISGANATAIADSYASGTDSLAAAISTNSSSYGATGSYSVAIGRQAKATGSGSVSLGGYNNQATGSNCLNVGGSSNVASSNYSATIGGYNTNADTQGKVVFGSGYASWTAGPQSGITTMFAATTDATATEVLAQNQRVTLPNNSAYSFSGTIVARQQAADGTACAAWKVEGLIRREGSAGTTTLVGSTVTAISNTPSWGLALSADTTNGGLKIEATGAASTDIRWVATIHTSEVIYA